MPGFNGRGPHGDGPMSGRGRGRCRKSSNNVPGNNKIEQNNFKETGKKNECRGGGNGNCGNGNYMRGYGRNSTNESKN